MLRTESLTRGFQNEWLVRWAADHPGLVSGDQWCAKAWWGAAAGEVVRDYLYDPHRRAVALDLVERVDDAALDEARRQEKGVIVVTAHLGPPKFLMNWLVEQRLPLLVWTNTRDLPSWQAAAGDTTFGDPRAQDQKSVILINSTIHLRRGGVLLGAADLGTGDRVVLLERLGISWHFSFGLPSLARRLGIPMVTALALWDGECVQIRFNPLDPPAHDLAEDEWNRAWIDSYWAIIEPVLRGSPENFRFLHRAVERVAKPWEQTGG